MPRFRLGKQQQSALEIVEPKLQAQLAAELGDDDAEGWRLVAAGWSGGVLDVPNIYEALGAVYSVLVDRLNNDAENAREASFAGFRDTAAGFRESARALGSLTSRIIKAQYRAPDCPAHLRAR